MGDPGDTVHLSLEEAAAVALHVSYIYLLSAWQENQFSWEDFPHLDEASYDLFMQQVEEVAHMVGDTSASTQQVLGIDARYLLEKIQ